MCLSAEVIVGETVWRRGGMVFSRLRYEVERGERGSVETADSHRARDAHSAVSLA